MKKGKCLLLLSMTRHVFLLPKVSIIMTLLFAFASDAITVGCGEECTPQCANKQCGDDGCGGSCGQCVGYESCSQDGLCISKYDQECSNMVDRMDACGVEVKGKSSEQLSIECKQQYSQFHQCLSECNTSTQGCSHFFACAFECGGGNIKDLCENIMKNVYDICGGVVFFRTADGKKLTRQEAYDVCIVDFQPVFQCARYCIHNSSICQELWTCLNDKC